MTKLGYSRHNYTTAFTVALKYLPRYIVSNISHYSHAI